MTLHCLRKFLVHGYSGFLENVGKSRSFGVILLNPGSTFLHITNEIYHWVLSVQLYTDCYQLFDIYTTFYRDLLLIQLQTLKCLYFYHFSRNIFIFTFPFDLTSFGVEVRFHQILCDPSERNLIFKSENWKNSSICVLGFVNESVQS